MSTPEEAATADPAITALTEQISKLGVSIAEAKQAKKPKEEWDPLLKEMLALKLEYKAKTGHCNVPQGFKENPKLAPNLVLIVRLPGPKTNAAVIIPGPSFFIYEFCPSIINCFFDRVE